ncbi:MAG: exonuclease domain-containing protein [Arenicella sp.]
MLNWRSIYHQWRRYRAIGKTGSTVMRTFLEQARPSDNLLANDCELLALDIETTGLSVDNDAILSVAYVPVVQRQIQLSSARHMLVKTAVDVGQSATIHGIHDQQLQSQGMSLNEVMDTLLKDLAGKVLLVHFSRLDYGMLNKVSRELYGVKLLCPVVDTLAIEYRHYKLTNADNIPPMQLDLCRERYGLPRYRAHNALVDAIATAELWLAQSAYMQGNQQLPVRFFVAR